MPDRKKHIEHSKELYGYGFEEIHKWMDGTVKSRGPSHRVDRHDIEKTPDKAYEIFKDKVPEKYRDYIKDVVKDHIELDERSNEIERVSSKKELFAKKDWTTEDTEQFERKEIKKIREMKEKYEEWEKEMLKGTEISRKSTSVEDIQRKRCYLPKKMAECVEDWRKWCDKNIKGEPMSIGSFYNQITGEKMSLEDLRNEFRDVHLELKKSLEGDENKRMSDESFLDLKWNFAIMLWNRKGLEMSYEDGILKMNREKQEDNGKCFIATASLSSSMHPYLDCLREFRDKTLLKFF